VRGVGVRSRCPPNLSKVGKPSPTPCAAPSCRCHGAKVSKPRAPRGRLRMLLYFGSRHLRKVGKPPTTAVSCCTPTVRDPCGTNAAVASGSRWSTFGGYARRRRRSGRAHGPHARREIDRGRLAKNLKHTLCHLCSDATQRGHAVAHAATKNAVSDVHGQAQRATAVSWSILQDNPF
jgi:hypothetical protein